MEWKTIDSAPVSAEREQNCVLVTRFPSTGRPLIMIAYLTKDCWRMRRYIQHKNMKGSVKLHFEPTHWQELPPLDIEE